MPIYEYLCEKCGQSTEAIQRLADPPLTECPKCGGKLRKKVSAPAFQFKGTGWYVTDYARKGGGGKGAKKGDGEKSAEKKDESKASTTAGDGGTPSSGSSEKKTGGEKAAAA
jgi:putative FmdB family regulatory protein